MDYKCTCKCGSVIISGFSKEETEDILKEKNYCAYCDTKKPEVKIEERKNDTEKKQG